MFTGIIEDCGRIKKIENNLFTISHKFQEPLTIGESIALSGMCSTIIKTDHHEFTVEIMIESRKRTIFGTAKVGSLINLERSAKIGTRNSGHFVLGHVDQVGKVIERKRVSDYELFKIAVAPENAKLIIFKGSVAIDGISLTISNLSAPKEKHPWIEVSIISHTLKVTNLKDKKVDDLVNLEFDVLGKYILRAKEIQESNTFEL